MTKNIRIRRSKHAATSGSGTEPIPLQSVSSGVDSHVNEPIPLQSVSSGVDSHVNEPIPLQTVSSAVDSHGTGPETQQQEIVIEDPVRPA